MPIYLRVLNSLKKGRLKRNGLHRNLKSRNNNNLGCGKSLSWNKRKIGRIFKSFPHQGYSCKKTVTSTEWVDTRVIKAIWRRDWIEIKELMKEQFAISTDRLDFSTAKCDMETANEFISFIIEQALELGINLYILGKYDKRYRHVLEIDNITQRYVIACLRKRVCCICGKEHNEYNTIELHHWNSVASIGGYENCDGLKTPFMSLCAKHHQEFHATGKETFKNKYYIEGVWLNVELVKELKKIYKNHFKAFKEEI